jgi:hypothetical protein
MVIYQDSFYDFSTTAVINPKNHIQHIQHTMSIIPPFPPTKHVKLDNIKQKIIQPPPPPPTDQALQKFRDHGAGPGSLIMARQSKANIFFYWRSWRVAMFLTYLQVQNEFHAIGKGVFHPKYCVQAMLLLWVEEMLKHMRNLMALSRS